MNLSIHAGAFLLFPAEEERMRMMWKKKKKLNEERASEVDETWTPIPDTVGGSANIFFLSPE